MPTNGTTAKLQYSRPRDHRCFRSLVLMRIHDLVKDTSSERNQANYSGCPALVVREDWLDIVLTHDSRRKRIGWIASMRKRLCTYIAPPKSATPFPGQSERLIVSQGIYIAFCFAENHLDLSVGSYWSAD